MASGFTTALRWDWQRSLANPPCCPFEVEAATVSFAKRAASPGSPGDIPGLRRDDPGQQGGLACEGKWSPTRAGMAREAGPEGERPADSE